MREVEIDVVVRIQTEKAMLVNFGAPDDVWVPKSQITDYCEENGVITSIFIPEWLAIQKGMV